MLADNSTNSHLFSRADDVGSRRSDFWRRLTSADASLFSRYIEILRICKMDRTMCVFHSPITSLRMGVFFFLPARGRPITCAFRKAPRHNGRLASSRRTGYAERAHQTLPQSPALLYGCVVSAVVVDMHPEVPLHSERDYAIGPRRGILGLPRTFMPRVVTQRPSIHPSFLCACYAAFAPQVLSNARARPIVVAIHFRHTGAASFTPHVPR